MAGGGGGGSGGGPVSKATSLVCFPPCLRSRERRSSIMECFDGILLGNEDLLAGFDDGE